MQAETPQTAASAFAARLPVVAQGAMLAMLSFHLFLWLQLWLKAPALPDFHNTYAAAGIWLHSHSAAYDLSTAMLAQAASAKALDSPYHFNPFVQIPAWLWVGGVLARLPYRAAYWAITVADVAMIAGATRLIVGSGLPRATRFSLYLFVAAALPTWVALFQAQTIPLSLLAAAAGFRLSSARPKLGGLLLSLGVVRYHVAGPVMFAVAWGRPLLTIGLLVGLGVIGVASVVAVDGNVAAWIASTRYVSTIYHPTDYSLRYFMEFTPSQARAFLNIAIIPLGAALAAYLYPRSPRGSCRALLAVALAWSLVTPYSYLGDLSLLVLLTAGSLAEWLRAGRLPLLPLVACAALLAGLELTPTFSFLSLLPAELLLLAALSQPAPNPEIRDLRVGEP